MRIKKVGRSTSSQIVSEAQLLMNKIDGKVVLEKPTKTQEKNIVNQSEGRKHRSLSSVSTHKIPNEKHEVTAESSVPDIVKTKNVILNKLYNENNSSGSNKSQTIVRNVRGVVPTNGNSKNLNIISTKISKAGNSEKILKEVNIKNKDQTKVIANIVDSSSTYRITRNGEIQESPGESISYDELSYDELTYDELSSSSDECINGHIVSPDSISFIDSDDDILLEAAIVEKSRNKKNESDNMNLNKTNKALRAVDKISSLTPTAISGINNSIKKVKELTKTSKSKIELHNANNILAKEQKEEIVRNGSKVGLNITPVKAASEETYSTMKAPEIMNGKIASEIEILARSKQIRRASVTAKTNIKEFTKSLRQNSRRDTSSSQFELSSVTPPKEETHVNHIKSLKRRVPADFKAEYVNNKLSKSLPSKSVSDENVDRANGVNVSNLFKKSNNKEEIIINSEKCASPLVLESAESYKTNKKTLKIDTMFDTSISDKNESDDEDDMKLVMDISSNSFEDNLEPETTATTKVNGLTNLYTNGNKNINIIDKAIKLDKDNHSTDHNGNKKIESNKHNKSVPNFENSNIIRVNIPKMKKNFISNSISQNEKNKPLVSVLSKENLLKNKDSISVEQSSKNGESRDMGATIAKRRETICLNKIPEPKVVVKVKPNSSSNNNSEDTISLTKRRMTICMNPKPKKESTPPADIVVQPEIISKPNLIRTRRKTFVELSSVQGDGKIIPGSRKTIQINPDDFDQFKDKFSSSKSRKSSTLSYGNTKVSTPITQPVQQPPIPKITIKKRESIYYSNFVIEDEDKSNTAVNMNPSKPKSTADNRNKIIMNNNNESSLKIVNVFSNFNSAGGDSAKNRRKESHVPKIVDDVEFECVDLTTGDLEDSEDIPKTQNKSVSNNVTITSGIRVRRNSFLIPRRMDEVTVMAHDSSKITSGSSLLLNRRKSILKPKPVEILFESNTEEYHPKNEHLMKCVSFARAALTFALEQRGLPTNLYRHAHSFDLLLKKYKLANDMAKGNMLNK